MRRGLLLLLRVQRLVPGLELIRDHDAGHGHDILAEEVTVSKPRRSYWLR
jgi:hypothetical protein